MPARHWRSDVSATGFPVWTARLDLGYTRRGEHTLLSQRQHHGPLRVQKPLYPEGPQVCHTLLLHPPSGLAGGDELAIHAGLDEGCQVLLTTPGAGKWYRSAGAFARQQVALRVAENARLEWLPQENILFNGTLAAMRLEVMLAASARFIGWDVQCLGRTASGERFAQGRLHLDSRILRAGQCLWRERGRLESLPDAPAAILASRAGWAGGTVNATLVAVVPAAESCLDDELLRACRAVPSGAAAVAAGLTRLPGNLLLGRWLGHDSEAARHWLTALWGLLRPALLGRPAEIPRVWRT